MAKSFFVLSLLIASVAMGQTHDPNRSIDTRSFTLVSVKNANGTRSERKIVLPAQNHAWSKSAILQIIKDQNLVNPDTVLRVDETRTSQSTKRLVVTAQFRDKPILDRDIIVNIDARGHLASIQANLPQIESVDEPVINEVTARAVLNEYILRMAGPANLSVGTDAQDGWVMNGNHLFPVIDIEVLDPSRLRHFTARIDTLHARVVGFNERTKN